MFLNKENIEDINRFRKLIELNERKNKEHGEYLWADQIMSIKILENAVTTNEDIAEEFLDKAYWLAIRLKFTSDEVINLMLQFYNGDIKYNETLYGEKIFDTIKRYSITFPEALLLIYEKHTNFKPTKEFSKYTYGKNRGNKLHYSFLENGKIKYEKKEVSKSNEEELRQSIEEKAKAFFK